MVDDKSGVCRAGTLHSLPRSFADLYTLASLAPRLPGAHSPPLHNGSRPSRPDTSFGLKPSRADPSATSFLSSVAHLGWHGYDHVIVDEDLEDSLREFGVGSVFVMLYNFSPEELEEKAPYKWEDFCVLWVTRDGFVAQYQLEDGTTVTDIRWKDDESVFAEIRKAIGWGTLQHPPAPVIPKVVNYFLLDYMGKEDPAFASKGDPKK
ncbi:hypothetical protein BJ508DRAFT_332307 [Ascobolus immersus RN42]|uniref:Uncharacterized protein n=1 Tax=Ascobolus immersus RN42 TaxID=1160509 RepID=A0A3N4HRS1_ASCIM|nr:hypothetical protein BJ508DRAFT_332307 [Ascobolus immersus RN42]